VIGECAWSCGTPTRTVDMHERPNSSVTEREGHVLRLLAAGLGPGQIGKELSISPKTVATHVEHIYAKLGVHTRAQAVAQAFRLALVE
jgi:DNA-binding CsgD family transcriptional regulator